MCWQAERLFVAVDQDQDGLVDSAELSELVQSLWTGMDSSAQIPDEATLNHQVINNAIGP